MWGRIDGSHGIVNNLLTTEQLRRLTAGAADARALADGLAAFVIPDGPDAASLAAAALAAGGVAAATPADNGFDIASARAALAEHYRAAIASITANGDKEELGKLRRDVARRFRYAILRDEIPDLVTACAADGGRPPRADELLADPATALFRVPSDQLCRKPGRFELAEDGANAIANALYAFAGRGHSRVGRLAIGTAALSARGAARLTGAVRATGRAFGKARRSVGRSA
jgi:hypothetical protein